jgi:hypothetical protein
MMLHAHLAAHRLELLPPVVCPSLLYSAQYFLFLDPFAAASRMTDLNYFVFGT